MEIFTVNTIYKAIMYRDIGRRIGFINGLCCVRKRIAI
uniref:Uncharacterized protein n=1 Tax=Oryza nivara TaxID=4536 RepID=A0A0E0HS22_ORYNI